MEVGRAVPLLKNGCTEKKKLLCKRRGEENLRLQTEESHTIPVMVVGRLLLVKKNALPGSGAGMKLRFNRTRSQLAIHPLIPAPHLTTAGSDGTARVGGEEDGAGVSLDTEALGEPLAEGDLAHELLEGDVRRQVVARPEHVGAGSPRGGGRGME